MDMQKGLSLVETFKGHMAKRCNCIIGFSKGSHNRIDGL